MIHQLGLSPPAQRAPSPQQGADAVGGPHSAGASSQEPPHPGWLPAPMSVPTGQRQEPPCSSPTAATGPVPVPAQPAEQLESQAGSPADAPLSLSPGTLRVASLSLVTPPSELVTSDMLGAAARGAGAQPHAFAASSTRSGPIAGGSTSDMLRALARGAVAKRNLKSAIGQRSEQPALSRQAAGPGQGPGGAAAPHADVRASPPAAASAAETGRISGVAAANQHDGGGMSTPAELEAGAAGVDTGLLASFLQAGPRASVEEVTVPTTRPPRRICWSAPYHGEMSHDDLKAAAATAAS